MINTGAIANLLRPGVKKVFGLYPQYGLQWKESGFKTLKSDMAFETMVEMQYLGMPSIVEEGSPIPSSTMGQRIVTTFTHKKIAIQFFITKEAIEDNLYKTEFPSQLQAKINSMRQGENVLAANIFNNAFSSNPAFIMGDGQPLASQNHPIFGGVYANTFGTGAPATDLSEAGLEAAILITEQFPDQAGTITATKAMKLVVPRELRFTSSRLLNSQYSPNTANNAINPINYDNYLPQGYTVNQFLTSPTAWFLVTDAEDGLTHFERTPLEHNMYPNYSNQTIGLQASKRLSFGVANPRGVFCAQ